jgi:hypothetical protein
MDAWTVAVLVGALIGVVIFVGWGPDIGLRRGRDDRHGGPDAPSGPHMPSGGGGDGGAGSS